MEIHQLCGSSLFEKFLKFSLNFKNAKKKKKKKIAKKLLVFQIIVSELAPLSIKKRILVISSLCLNKQS